MRSDWDCFVSFVAGLILAELTILGWLHLTGGL